MTAERHRSEGIEIVKELEGFPKEKILSGLLTDHELLEIQLGCSELEAKITDWLIEELDMQ